MKKTRLDERSIKLRSVILDMVNISRRGHIGSAFSALEIIRVLYDSFLSYKPKNPNWKERDRFILSKGHGCLALYAVLGDKNFFPKKELLRFCKFDSILGGHPQYGKVPGVEASTGSLGHGLSLGLGMALAAKMEKKKYRTFILLSDGECDEGSTWEAILAVGKHKLPNLITLVDYNKMQSYGTTKEILDLEPFADKWRSFGFRVQEVDGHNISEIKRAIKKAMKIKRIPNVIICHTVKGKGVPFIENHPAWHHKSRINDEEMKKLYKELGDEKSMS